ncbi:MAG TPA: hypothetical protein VJ276_02505, partial [Thermoanaerobaculia bacterium]|nr:hypothetical protein [Thermoanaerobaculia bacterium]
TTAATSTAAGRDVRRLAGGTPARQRGGSVYTLDANGKLQQVRVQTGITDGTQTEVQGQGLAEGMKVVIGTTSSTQSAQSSSASPFQSNSGSQQRRAPGGF